MSEDLQPGQHPDPDSLNAFIEGVLPEHERVQCLAHLAECPMCREVVYLAEEPLASEPLPMPAGAEKVSLWKRWFTPVPALSTALVAGTLVLSFWLYQHFKSVPNTPELVVSATHTAAEQVASAPETVSQPSPAYREKHRAPREEKSAVPQPEPVETTAPVMPAAAPPSLPVRAAPEAASSDTFAAAQTGVAGKITDPAGAAIAGAAVKLSPIAGPASRNLISDPKGQFNVAGLEPGRYELQIQAPGFKQETKQVDIRPDQMAHADSILSLGSVSESISVTAATAQVQLESNDRSAVPPLPNEVLSQALSAQITARTPGITFAPSALPALPSKLPANTTVGKGQLMLATDSAGALFLSQNAGKKWKAVKPVWHGKVVGLVALSAGTAFQLTTDSGATWLSSDGSHWRAAPAQK